MSEKLLKEKREDRNGPLTIRVFMAYVIVILASVGVLYRIIDLQAFHKTELRSQFEADKKTIKPVYIPVERGIILSRNNEVLVERLPTYKIYMDTYPTEKKNGVLKINLPDSIFDKQITALSDSLTALFGATTPSWEQKLKEARAEKKRYVKISDNATKKDCVRLQEFPIFSLITYDRNGKKHVKYNPYAALCKPEVNLDNVIYPYGELAKRTLGYPNTTEDSRQRRDTSAGLEGYFDKVLAGTPGLILRKYIGGVATDIESEDNVQPCDGYNITTTLDMTIQYIAHDALQNALNHHDAEKGCAIVMEVATGDIVAMVNLSKTSSGKYREIENNALAMYEPGSTFKTASMMVALEDGKVTPNTLIPTHYDRGLTAKIGHRDVTDDHNIGKNITELWEVFAQSSNVGTTRAIYNNYASQQQKFIDGLYKLGFGDMLRFPVIGGDRKPLLRDTSHPMWSKMSISTIPYGYELTVTPLHLLTFYNAIANNGCMVQPRIVTKISSGWETIQTIDVDTLNAQICSAQTLQYMRSMLDSVVTRGTARRAFLKAPYSVAGKTGTAKDNDANTRTKVKQTKRELYYSTFCGYFPADAPKYSCVVVVKWPRQNGYGGGAVAAPVFRNIADKLYAMDYDLMPEVKGIAYKYEQPAPIKNVDFPKNTIPDVTGMSLTDAIYILEKAGIKAEIKGFGRVKEQIPEAGTPLKENQKVIVKLDIKG